MIYPESEEDIRRRQDIERLEVLRQDIIQKFQESEPTEAEWIAAAVAVRRWARRTFLFGFMLGCIAALGATTLIIWLAS